MRKYFIFILVGELILFLVFFTACRSEDNKENTVQPGTVYFRNLSSYPVDIYMTINPAIRDPSAIVCSLTYTGEKKGVKLYPSFNKRDAFFPRYRILLADRRETGTVDLFIDAQRVLTNITVPIESGGVHERDVPDPKKGELSFFHGYLEINNNNNYQYKLIRGTSIQNRYDNDDIYISPFQQHVYYEIEFSALDDVILMNQLKVFSSYDIQFPSFNMERGFKYIFYINNDTVTGPVIKNVDPLAN